MLMLLTPTSLFVFGVPMDRNSFIFIIATGLVTLITSTIWSTSVSNVVSRDRAIIAFRHDDSVCRSSMVNDLVLRSL